MKKWIFLFLGVALAGSLTFLPSCTTEQPTTGILVIQVVDTNGYAIASEQVYLATSLQNLKSGNYFTEQWTNEKGIVVFSDLLPLNYWYDTRDWEDYGAAQVWAGIEHIVTLTVNTPQP